ncbi:peroxiredoxin [Shumkonia mesophila]|uniref:peroxiredoxin n=1 Tax=Shumkonia mesophila TaxID=2838854 RepID=UPI002934C2CD|nr:peroxiredoxin [Shumkonia mesophila]
MTIKVGDRLPSATFMTMGKDGPQPLSSDELFKGKKVALFGVPGAFTPTCSVKHLPGYVKNADQFKVKGVDTVACIAVNDVFVLEAWRKSEGVGDTVKMLADGSGDFAKAAGLTFDLSGKGLGVRLQRFSAIVDDGVVKSLNVEEPGAFEVSGAEKLLGQL